MTDMRQLESHVIGDGDGHWPLTWRPNWPAVHDGLSDDQIDFQKKYKGTNAFECVWNVICGNMSLLCSLICLLAHSLSLLTLSLTRIAHYAHALVWVMTKLSFWRITRPDTRPSVACGWAGAVMLKYQRKSCAKKKRVTDGRTDTPSYKVACTRLKRGRGERRRRERWWCRRWRRKIRGKRKEKKRRGGGRRRRRRRRRRR